MPIRTRLIDSNPPPSSAITPRAVYEDRRTLLKALALGAAGSALAGWAARHPGGQRPGECAAALLLTRAGRVPQLPVAEGAVAQIGRLVVSPRGGGAEADDQFPGRLGGVPPGGLVCDGAHLAAGGAAFPATLAHLDPRHDCLATGSVVGLAPPAGALVRLQRPPQQRDRRLCRHHPDEPSDEPASSDRLPRPRRRLDGLLPQPRRAGGNRRGRQAAPALRPLGA